MVQFIDPLAQRRNPIPPAVHIEQLVADGVSYAAVSYTHLTIGLPVRAGSVNVHNPAANRDRNRLGPVVHGQFRQNVFHVALHGLVADVEFGRDLLISHAARHQAQNFHLAIGQNSLCLLYTSRCV